MTHSFKLIDSMNSGLLDFTQLGALQREREKRRTGGRATRTGARSGSCPRQPMSGGRFDSAAAIAAMAVRAGNLGLGVRLYMTLSFLSLNLLRLI
jgi:hypothetical protein